MQVTRENLLSVLPPYSDKWVLIKEDQDVKDIIKSMLQSHKDFAGYYDKIAGFFESDCPEQLGEDLYQFCKANIEYREESVEQQTTALPTGILTRGYGDCKHYASFCGGILDAINRARGLGLKWNYCFASYRLDERTPYHVFIVLEGEDGPIWIDPTPGAAEKTPVWVVNKTVKAAVGSMALIKNIAGVTSTGPGYDDNYSPIQASEAGDMSAATGQTKIMAVGKGLVTVSAALVEVPVAAAIVAAVGLLTTLVGSVFGNKWHTSTQVRWLLKHFQYSVLGQANVTSDNKVDETLLQDALNWFTAVLGVPIYDDDRLQVLAGNDYEGNYLNNSYDERAAKYLEFWDAQREGVTMARAVEAAKAADYLRIKYPEGPGAWNAAPISKYWVKETGQASGAAAAASVAPIERLKQFFANNKKLVLIGGGLLAVYFIFQKDIDKEVQKL